MKTPRLSSRASRLFAVLIRDSAVEHGVYGGRPAYNEYLDWLRSQSKRGYAGCAYRRAIALIEGRA